MISKDSHNNSSITDYYFSFCPVSCHSNYPIDHVMRASRVRGRRHAGRTTQRGECHWGGAYRLRRNRGRQGLLRRLVKPGDIMRLWLIHKHRPLLLGILLKQSAYTCESYCVVLVIPVEHRGVDEGWTKTPPKSELSLIRTMIP